MYVEGGRIFFPEVGGPQQPLRVGDFVWPIENEWQSPRLSQLCCSRCKHTFLSDSTE